MRGADREPGGRRPAGRPVPLVGARAGRRAAASSRDQLEDRQRAGPGVATSTPSRADVVVPGRARTSRDVRSAGPAGARRAGDAARATGRRWGQGADLAARRRPTSGRDARRAVEVQVRSTPARVGGSAAGMLDDAWAARRGRRRGLGRGRRGEEGCDAAGSRRSARPACGPSGPGGRPGGAGRAGQHGVSPTWSAAGPGVRRSTSPARGDRWRDALRVCRGSRRGAGDVSTAVLVGGLRTRTRRASRLWAQHRDQVCSGTATDWPHLDRPGRLSWRRADLATRGRRPEGASPMEALAAWAAGHGRPARRVDATQRAGSPRRLLIAVAARHGADGGETAGGRSAPSCRAGARGMTTGLASAGAPGRVVGSSQASRSLSRRGTPSAAVSPPPSTSAGRELGRAEVLQEQRSSTRSAGLVEARGLGLEVRRHPDLGGAGPRQIVRRSAGHGAPARGRGRARPATAPPPAWVPAPATRRTRSRRAGRRRARRSGCRAAAPTDGRRSAGW